MLTNKIKGDIIKTQTKRKGNKEMTDYEIMIALEWGMTAEEIFQMLEEGEE